VLAPDAPGLARNASCKQINSFRHLAEVEGPNVRLKQFPISDVLKIQSLIRPNGRTCVMIEFNDGLMLETGLR
jgi:hypothetical protein